MTYTFSNKTVEGITLEELQSEVSEWQRHNFPEAALWESVMGAAEEVGELCHSYLKKHQGIRKNVDFTYKMKDAVGDTIVYLTDFCQKNGWNIRECIEIAWGEARERDWKAFPNDGRTE